MYEQLEETDFSAEVAVNSDARFAVNVCFSSGNLLACAHSRRMMSDSKDLYIVRQFATFGAFRWDRIQFFEDLPKERVEHRPHLHYEKLDPLSDWKDIVSCDPGRSSS